MKKSVFYFLALFLSVFFVSCGDDEPSDGSSSGGNHEWVDLGLPSGTLWATMNVGASKPEDHGNYFAWGETAPKQVFGWDKDKWYNTATGKYTKYSPDVDSKTELDPSDDAAYVNWGSKWRTPTEAQLKELITECTWQWNGNGSGYLLTSKKNGKTLILPAAGFYDGSYLTHSGRTGYYWSRTLDASNSKKARYLLCQYESVFGKDEVYVSNLYSRGDGLSVRAVRIP